MPRHIELLVEDRSTAVVLETLMPRLCRRATWLIHEHRSKNDLLAKLPGKLRAYAAYLPPSSYVVVVVDRDRDDCHSLKSKLEDAALDAGLPTKTHPRDGRFRVVTRLAIEELEAWYFGDWEAVVSAFPRVDPSIPRSAGYRASDAIRGGTWEALERVLQDAGYFKSGLRKITAAREIAQHMDPARSSSPSFCRLRDALATITAG